MAITTVDDAAPLRGTAVVAVGGRTGVRSIVPAAALQQSNVDNVVDVGRRGSGTVNGNTSR